MIAPHILALSILLSIPWGWHMVDEVRDWIALRRDPRRSKAALGRSLRSMICAICLWSICVAYALRSATVLLGFGDTVAGQVAFFTVIGVNVPGAIFAVASRKFD